jgi:hypothetical protein
MTQVEVDEVLGLMCHEAAKVASNNAVPGRSLSLVKCALDMLGNILLNGELGHGLLSDFDSLLLHILGLRSRWVSDYGLVSPTGPGRCAPCRRT